MAEVRPPYERKAWIVFAGIGAVALFIGISGKEGPVAAGSLVDTIRNGDGSALSTEVFLRGTFALAAGVVTIGLAVGGLRHFSRAAWWTLWVWPVFFLLHVVHLRTYVPDLVFALLCIAALGASARPVFARRAAGHG